MFNHCEFCGGPLPSGSRSSARFCSVKCKQAAYRRRADPDVGTIQREADRIRKSVETKQSTLIERTCPICGRKPNLSVSQANTLYCSAACKQKAYRQRQRSDEQTPATTTTPTIGRVIDPDELRESGIHNRRLLAKQRGDYVKLIKTGDDQDGKLGHVWGTPLKEEPAPEGYVWVEFRTEKGEIKRICSEADLEIMVWNSDGGPRGIQQLLERMTVAYRQRYGFDWMYAGGKVRGGINGYYVDVDGKPFYLNDYYAAKAHFRDYFNVGVSNQAMLRAR